MECDYCGLATGVYARWEVSHGAPGDGLTRYPCDQHLAAAYRHVAQVGLPVLRPMQHSTEVRPAVAGTTMREAA
ncbi:hypothetical protein [Micromonospora sediminicola]|uniref:hypothetical protein n=1 Tax=Micromonospora sediminicola TaxID=946078 RepID=UPI00378B7030